MFCSFDKNKAPIGANLKKRTRKKRNTVSHEILEDYWIIWREAERKNEERNENEGYDIRFWIKNYIINQPDCYKH